MSNNETTNTAAATYRAAAAASREAFVRTPFVHRAYTSAKVGGRSVPSKVGMN